MAIYNNACTISLLQNKIAFHPTHDQRRKYSQLMTKDNIPLKVKWLSYYDVDLPDLKMFYSKHLFGFFCRHAEYAYYLISFIM